MIWIGGFLLWLMLVSVIVWWFHRRGRAGSIVPVVNAQRISSPYRTPAGRIKRGF